VLVLGQILYPFNWFDWFNSFGSGQPIQPMKQIKLIEQAFLFYAVEVWVRGYRQAFAL
jgi:hypothetical protein